MGDDGVAMGDDGVAMGDDGVAMGDGERDVSVGGTGSGRDGALDQIRRTHVMRVG